MESWEAWTIIAEKGVQWSKFNFTLVSKFMVKNSTLHTEKNGQNFTLAPKKSKV